MKKRKPAQGLVHNRQEPSDDAEYEGEEQKDVGEAGEKEGGLQLGRKHPTKKIPPKTVKIETGLPVDRNRGYRKDFSRQRFTGADARAALVGAYEKKRSKRPAGFPRTSRSY